MASDGEVEVTAYEKIYDRESYLFGTVTNKFRAKGFLSAFDFFCIIIWKAERAKSRIADKIMSSDRLVGRNLDERVRLMTETILKIQEPQERLRYLMNDLKFRLPMASAILTVLYPDEFTVCDTRVCDQLPGKTEHNRLINKVNPEAIWSGYVAFREEVKNAAPAALSLRDKDRYLWGKSFCDQLRTDIENKFRGAKSE